MSLAGDAQKLLSRHADLLAGECSFRETTAQREAVAALDAARERLQGGARPAADQMTLDLPSR